MKAIEETSDTSQVFLQLSHNIVINNIMKKIKIHAHTVHFQKKYFVIDATSFEL